MKNENAPTLAGNQGGKGCATSVTLTRPLSPRLVRLLKALVTRVEITREQADRIAHASNSPECVRVLRHNHRINVKCRYDSATDYDGKPCRYGVYWLDSDSQAANELLQAHWRLVEACQAEGGKGDVTTKKETVGEQHPPASESSHSLSESLGEGQP